MKLRIWRFGGRFCQHRQAFPAGAGQAMVEYALILALVAGVAVGTLRLLGTQLNDVLYNITGAIGQ
jgi:Flp pilus assembly pilin Flp